MHLQTLPHLQKTPLLQYFAAKPKSISDKARLAVIGPGLKLLAFGMNHIGVLGDDVKKVISEQATVLSRQGTCYYSTAIRFYVLTYQLLFIPSTLSPSMLENAILVP